MKTKACILSALILNLAALSALAGGKESDGGPLHPSIENSPARVYPALNVPEVNVTPEGILGGVTFEKSVGGLVCQRSRAVVPNPVDRYSCTLAAEGAEGRDDGAIYDALDVAEKNLLPPHNLGVGYTSKTAGNLTCTRREVVYPGAQPSFACTLK